ncbi:nuclear pore complex protein GP210 isoform X1 [Rhodamnia argentea]|uniref:Nuclear pore complex protein GP210 isoform X1 n=1 Tax=Rhodamnia argentea TaxID=178133 RepID=A0A8B8P7L1_9MYRT|nr:nuclear pore complex protein GP210 isoform X1 [Rhodamnia argentea]
MSRSIPAMIGPLWLLPLLMMAAVERTSSYVSSGPHLADVNILLPPRMTHPVEYRLQGSDGCFKWTWDHHDILSVLPEYNTSNRCSTSARIRSIAPYNGRKETAIYATDIHTGIVIRCKVFIDIFSRIQIFHNSIKLDLDGLATLRVRAFDSEENVFSSLVGLQFMWQLTPETNGFPHHLIHVPLKDSPLSDCGGMCGDLDIQIKLEDNGVFADFFVVKGVGIGHEIVSVHLLEPELKHMADEIVLTVAEAMSIEPPSPVYVLVGASVHYILKLVRGNTPQVVSLPSPHYRWSTLNSSVAHVDPIMGVAHAKNLGITTVIVEDTRVAGHMQVSSLNVVVPDSIVLYILPLSNNWEPIEGIEAIPSVTRWYLVAGHRYVVHIKVFSQGPGSQEVYITESDDLSLYDHHSENWEVSLVSDDIVVERGWRNSRILKAATPGLGKLTASLAYSGGSPGSKEVLKIAQEVMVCDKVKIILDKRSATSDSIMLPWAPAIYQEVQLKAVGGCAKVVTDFKWYSSDTAILSVSTSGVVQAKKPGKSTIKVLSVYDSFNYDEVIVEVSTPAAMVMLPNFPVETVVGSHLKAAVTLKASTGSHFYRCDAFGSFIKWKAGSESFIIVNETGETTKVQNIIDDDDVKAVVNGPPCSWTYIYAAGSGQTLLHAALPKEYHHFDPFSHGTTALKASSRIAAFLPLVLRQVGDGNHFGGYWIDFAQVEADGYLESLDKIYLVPGTYVDVMLLEGPERWDGDVDYIETVECLDKEPANLKDHNLVEQLHSSYRSLYRVSCQLLGTFDLVFKRGNLVGVDHPLPAIGEASLSVMCSFPSSIVLIADEPVNRKGAILSASQAERTPERVRATPVTVANGRTIRVAAVSIASSGEVFANSSSLGLRWELSNCDELAFWNDNDDVERAQSGWECFLVLRNGSGLCIVRATVVGSDQITNSDYLGSESSREVLTDAMRLQLVSTLHVNPEYSLLFFNPRAKLNLSISGGSCFLESSVNDSQIVEVIHPPPGLQCSQLMLSPRGLGTALVTVNDIGLAPPQMASATVLVADVDWIKITSGEEISLMEGGSLYIDIVTGTNDGGSFDFSQYVYMDLQVHIEDDIVELVDSNDNSSRDDAYVKGQSFMIIAKHLGVTTLYVSVKQQSGHELRSQPIKIEVYAPPRIHPYELSLAPGASYVLTVRGGPKVGVLIEYSSLEDGIAIVHRTSGRLSAVSPGNTTMLATIFGRENSVLCRATGSVNVVVPSSAVLNVQSEKLGVNREMPIYPAFFEGDLFSLYEICKNYKWTIEDEKVLGFNTGEQFPGEKIGNQLVSSKEIQLSYFNERELGFIKVLLGRSAGKARVSVSFSCDFVSASFSESKFYSSSVSVSVIPDPPLALGVPITWILPPQYITSTLLSSSFESYGQWDSHSGKGTVTYSLLRNCGELNEKALSKTISIQDNRIKTAESNEVACIQAKDHLTGRIEIASCIRVNEVAQVRFANKEFPFHVVNLALGAEIELPIGSFDALGYAFYEAYDAVALDTEVNYPDIVYVNTTNSVNRNINLKAVQHGTALLRVSISGSTRKSDYALVSVGAFIYPQNPILHIGNSLEFNLEGFKEQVSGRWTSANDSVITIDLLSGKSKAVGEGTTRVIFKSSSAKLQTEVMVLGSDMVSVDAPRKALSNVPFPVRGYEFHVKFSDGYNKKKERVPYDCVVDPPFVGYAKAWTDLDTGNSYCLFFPYSPEYLVRSTLKSKDMRSDISISVKAILREARNASGSASALFIGGFSILGMDKDAMLLNLTPDCNRTTITLLGNTDIEIQQSPNLITITPIRREGFGIGSVAEYEVSRCESQLFE